MGDRAGVAVDGREERPKQGIAVRGSTRKFPPRVRTGTHGSFPLHRRDEARALESGGHLARSVGERHRETGIDRKSTRLNSSHSSISYAVFCLKKKQDSYAKINA